MQRQVYIMSEQNNKLITYEVQDFSKYSSECCKSEIPSNVAELLFVKTAKKINRLLREENNIIVGTSKGKQKNDLVFYDDTFQDGLVQGVVGVVIINGIDIQKEDFEDEEIYNEYINNYVIPLYDVKITIKSRFDTGREAYFLATMLLNADTELNNYNIDFSYDDIFEHLLVLLYKRYFKEAYKEGYYRKYQYFESNDNKMRGKIDIARHIKLNAGNDNGKIACSYREYTIDNSFNHLIIHTYLYIKSRFPNVVDTIIDSDFEMKKIIDNLIYNAKSYANYDVRTVINKSIKPISHPLYFNYENLRMICLDILNNLGISIFNGTDKEVKGILYYIPDLWEEFLYKQVLSKISDGEYTCKSQEQIKIFNEKKSTYPDFVFRNEDDDEKKPFYILDAKFKPSWYDAFASDKLGNLLEDYTKCIRDMNSINAHACGTIFPTNEEVNYSHEKICKSISNYNKKDEFHCFPVHVPKSDGYINFKNWQEKFQDSLSEAKKYINKYVKHVELKKKILDINNLIESMKYIESYHNDSISDVISSLTEEKKQLDDLDVKLINK